MSDEIKPMTVVVVAIFPDGSPRIRVEGRGSIGDVLLAAKTLELEAADAFARGKLQQEMSRPRVVGVPAMPPDLERAAKEG